MLTDTLALPTAGVSYDSDNGVVKVVINNSSSDNSEKFCIVLQVGNRDVVRAAGIGVLASSDRLRLLTGQ